MIDVFYCPQFVEHDGYHLAHPGDKGTDSETFPKKTDVIATQL